MVTNRKGKTVRETITEFPAPDLGQMPAGDDDEDRQMNEQQIPPEADEFIALLENIPGASSLKAHVSRVLPTGGEVWLGTITAKDCNVSAPQETLRARWGGGKYTVRATHPATNEAIETTFDIEGQPKGEGSAQPFQIHLPSNGKNGDGEAMASVFSMIMQLNQNFMLQMAESQRENTKLVAAALQQRPSGSGPSLEEIMKFKALFSDNEAASAKKLEHWIAIGSLLIEKVSQIVAPQSDNPWAALFNSLGPKIAETVGMIGTNLAAKRGMVPPATGAVGAAATGTPSGPVAATTAPTLTPEQVAQSQQYFERSILPDWMDAADKNEDPYTIKRNVKMLIGEDTRAIWHYLGLPGPQDFYSKYPRARQQQEWFDELFRYLNNPDLGPESDEPTNGSAEPATTVELIR